MNAEEVRIHVVTDLAEAPGWIEMKRDYLNFAVVCHSVNPGDKMDSGNGRMI